MALEKALVDIIKQDGTLEAAVQEKIDAEMNDQPWIPLNRLFYAHSHSTVYPIARTLIFTILYHACSLKLVRAVNEIAW